MRDTTRINKYIRAAELRIIGPEGENFGVMPFKEAFALAESKGLDLIEISPTAVPPVAKIMEYGKYLYDENKKQKAAKSRSKSTETKGIQVKVATSDHDLELKAKKTSEWLREGNRVKIDLFLSGRAKYMDQNFLKERLDRILKLISEDFKISSPVEKGPKGFTVTIERGAKGQSASVIQKPNPSPQLATAKTPAIEPVKTVDKK